METNEVKGNGLNSLLGVLRNDPECGEAFREAEAVEKEVEEYLEFVDLDVMFSPVVMSPGQKLESAVEVSYKSEDGRYVIESPLTIVDPEKLRVMRARFLVLRGQAAPPISEMLRMPNVQNEAECKQAFLHQMALSR